MSEETKDTTEQVVDTNPETIDSGEPETFDREYVEKLRRENAAKRKEKEEVETKLKTKLRDLVIAQEAGQILADPNDLLLYNPDLNAFDEEGNVSADRIREAAHELRKAKPHLAAKQFGKDIGAGNRGDDSPKIRTFHDMLRQFG